MNFFQICKLFNIYELFPQIPWTFSSSFSNARTFFEPMMFFQIREHYSSIYEFLNISYFPQKVNGQLWTEWAGSPCCWAGPQSDDMSVGSSIWRRRLWGGLWVRYRFCVDNMAHVILGKEHGGPIVLSCLNWFVKKKCVHSQKENKKCVLKRNVRIFFELKLCLKFISLFELC